MGKGEVVVPRSGYVPVLHQGKVKVSVETPLDLGHISEPGDAPHAYLFPLLQVGERRRHVSTPGAGRREQSAD